MQLGQDHESRISRLEWRTDMIADRIERDSADRQSQHAEVIRELRALRAEYNRAQGAKEQRSNNLKIAGVVIGIIGLFVALGWMGNVDAALNREEKMKATELDWSSRVHPRLSRDEWPGDVLEHMGAGVILALSDLRKSSGAPLWPSPVEGAHVRHRDCSSRHCTRNGARLSDATDFFARWSDAPRVLLHAMHQGSIGGIGIYDSLMLQGTQGDYCMFHIDTRPNPVYWVGHGREPVEYVYAHDDPSRYHQLISRMFESHGH